MNLVIGFLEDLEDMYYDTNCLQQGFVSKDGRFISLNPKWYPPFCNGCHFESVEVFSDDATKNGEIDTDGIIKWCIYIDDEGVEVCEILDKVQDTPASRALLSVEAGEEIKLKFIDLDTEEAQEEFLENVVE